MINTKKNTPTDPNANAANFLQEEYTIDTPENVTFAYDVVGIGSRFIGALVDALILVTTLIVLNILFSVLAGLTEELEFRMMDWAAEVMGWTTGFIWAIYAIINFIVIWGYYILFELMWNGQTPGKRVAKIRVLRMDGNTIGFTEVLIRNFVRIIDFLPLAYGLGLFFMLFNKHARRLGDFAAGTIVVRAQTDVSLENINLSDLRRPIKASSLDHEALLTEYPNLRNLTPDDYALIQESLSRYQKWQLEWRLLHQLSVAIAKKIGTTEPERRQESSIQFLKKISAAYRSTI